MIDKRNPDDGVTVQHEVIDEQEVIAELASVAALKTAEVEDALARGGVWLSKANGKAGTYKKPVRIRECSKVRAGDRVHLNFNAKVLAMKVDPPLMISDQVNYSLWYKPPGVYSQGTRWGDHSSMPFLVEKLHGKPAHLVHRLDRAASGLMVLAHTRNALKALASLFEKRAVEKTYQARVAGEFRARLPREINTPVDGKPALTRVLQCSISQDGTSLLTVGIDTGRKHQIRSHLASLGHPVVGDRLFDPDTAHRHDLQLVAIRLCFTCPFTEQSIAVDLPERFKLQPLTGSSESDGRATIDNNE